MIKNDQFPKPSFISSNRKVWFVDQIAAWQREIDGQGRGGLRKAYTKKTKAKAASAEA
jgi:hypothetical protein